MPRRTAFLFAAAALSALAGAVPAAVVAAPTAEPAASVRLVLAPTPGRHPARPTLIRVRAGIHDVLAARLNGHSLTRHFDPSVNGVRRLRVSPGHGLRFGANTLVVRVRTQSGRVRIETVRFRIATNRPLASAGPDRYAAVGNRLRLDATASLVHRAGRALGTRTSYRWTVTGGPKGLSATRLGATLRGLSSARPAFRATTPGTYRMRLRVAVAGGRTGTDVATVRVDPPPLIPVDTMATQDGKSGIRFGGTFYPATPGAYLQFLVVSRDDGTVRSNDSFTCADSTGSKFLQCAAPVRTRLGQLSSADIVIASAQPDGDGTKVAPRGMAYALGALQLPSGDGPPTDGDGLVRGTFSAIGSPGNAGGAGVQHYAETNTVGGGRMQGALVRNNRLHYVFNPGDRVGFDTQAPGSDAGKNIVKLGAQSFTEFGPGGGAGGFQVVTVDDRTLKGTSIWVGTGGTSGNTALNGMITLRNLLQAANTGHKLVVVVTRGNPRIDSHAYNGLVKSHDLYHAIRDAATAAENLGGTRNGLYTVIDPDFNQGNSYTLVGHSRMGPGNGEQALGKQANQGQGGLNAGPIGGALARTSSTYGYEVEAPDNEPVTGPEPPPNAGDLLADTIYQDPQRWPGASDKGIQAAIAYIGDQVGLGTDPRSQYWTQPYSTSFWDPTRRAIAALNPDPLPAGVSAGDLKSAKDELVREIDWLGGAHDLVTNLAAPYANTAFQNWAAFTQVAGEVNTAVNADPSAQTRAIAKEVFDGVRELLGTLPFEVAGKFELGLPFEIANIIYDTAMDIAETAKGESAEDVFSTKVNDLGVELTDRMQAAQDTLTGRFFRVAAADYGKLRRLGACALRQKDYCPDDPGRWQVTNDDLTRMGQALRGGMRTEFTTSLLSAKYTLWTIPDQYGADYTEAKKWVGHGVLGVGDFAPFGASPAKAQVADIVCRDMNDHSRDQWSVSALGLRKGSGTVNDPWTMETPSASVIDPLFAPIDPEKFPSGGLGADRDQVFHRVFAKRSDSIANFPLKDSLTGWDPFNYPGDCYAP